MSVIVWTSYQILTELLVPQNMYNIWSSELEIVGKLHLKHPRLTPKQALYSRFEILYPNETSMTESLFLFLMP